jgi:hypothetical protein
MKKLIACLISAVAAFGVTLSHATFGPERDIGAPVPGVGSQFPVVAYYNNVIHVAWEGYQNGNASDIFYARSSDNGSSFSTPVNLSQLATPSVGAARPQIAASALGVFVAWHMVGTTADLRIRRSTDGGLSFGGAVSIANSAGGNYLSLTHLMADSAGRIHVAYYSDKPPAPAFVGMVHHRSTCDGNSWGTDTQVTVTAVDGDWDNEQPTLAESGGRVFMAFRSSRNGTPQGGFPPQSVQVQSGVLNTGTCTVAWSYPARRAAGGLPQSYASSSQPRIIADSTGKVHLAWWDSTHGDNVAYRAASAASGNGLGAFSAPAQVSTFTVDHPQPGGLLSSPAAAAGGFQVPPAVASNGTNAYVAYHQIAAVSSNSERGPVYLEPSPDNGVTWSPALQVVSSHGATPSIAIGGTTNQNVAVVWADDRTGVSHVYHKLYTPGVDPFTQAVQDIITGYYNTILLRVPDAPGLQYWTDQATRVVNLGADVREVFYTMSIQFFNSPEYLNRATTDTQYLTDLYQTFFARPPDAGGLSYWQGQMNQGMDRISVLNNFLFSPEFANAMSAKFGTPTVRPEVNLIMDLYRGILGNLPDDGGFGYYVGLLRTAQCSGQAAQVNGQVNNISTQFVTSQQYQNTEAARPANLRNNYHISDLYNAFLRRGADIGGYTYYVGQLNTGSQTRTQIRNGFISSAEFQGRVAAVIAATCIP